jgi:hypothetical protein
MAFRSSTPVEDFSVELLPVAGDASPCRSEAHASQARKVVQPTAGPVLRK